MISDILNNAGRGIVKAIQDNHFRANQNASGRTIASLKYNVEEDKKGFTLLVDADRHFPVLEEGRRPGKMPPLGKIKSWVQDRGLPDGLAWGISKAIAKNGTKLFKQGGRKDIYSNVITDEAINDILKGIADDFQDESFEEVKKDIN